MSLKTDLILNERDSLIKLIAKIDEILDSDIEPNDIGNFLKQMIERFSVSSAIEWLQPIIEQSRLDIEKKLNQLTKVLDKEFHCPSNLIGIIHPNKQIIETKFLEQIKANLIVRLYLDNSIILYALGKNGAAIIEMYSILERQTIEKLSNTFILPEKKGIGQKILDRLTLKDVAGLLKDSEILDTDDIKFVNKINKLRNGFAHRNLEAISKAILSGKQLKEYEIDSLPSDQEYIQYVLQAIRYLIKIFDIEPNIN